MSRRSKDDVPFEITESMDLKYMLEKTVSGLSVSIIDDRKGKYMHWQMVPPHRRDLRVFNCVFTGRRHQVRVYSRTGAFENGAFDYVIWTIKLKSGIVTATFDSRKTQERGAYDVLQEAARLLLAHESKLQADRNLRDAYQSSKRVALSEDANAA